jgi:hypothetical protein
MLGKKTDTKQYSVSQEDVYEISRLAQGQWLVQKIFKYSVAGFNQEIGNIQKNIVAKLAIDEEKYDVDWATLFKDNKIYTHPKPVEEKKEDAQPSVPTGV